MLNLKGNISFLKSDPDTHQKAISKQRGALKYFMSAPRFRSELPDTEEKEGQLAA